MRRLQPPRHRVLYQLQQLSGMGSFRRCQADWSIIQAEPAGRESSGRDNPQGVDGAIGVRERSRSKRAGN
jgi:hypothetical protein